MAGLVVDLAQVGRDDLALAGGKGANLGELVRAGLPVPPGFIVTTVAYDEFVAVHDLGRVIALADPAATQAGFERAAMPPAMERELREAYARLGAGPVAVRSSATAEDLPGAAFAGQQETFLNVIGQGPLLDAVRRCWASLWAERAVAYRARMGVDQAGVKLAVVVQRLVAAEAAGVLFTANPLTGDRYQTLIDASPGLGEAVVSGLVTPDHYVLRRTWRGWQVIERQPGRREVVVRPLAGGGTEHITGESIADARLVLTTRSLRRLARVGARIERHFGRPQDVEWAVADGHLFVLQARPMTALPPGRTRALPPPVASMAGELLAVRPYPLDVTTWAPAVFGAVAPLFDLLGLAEQPMEQLFTEDDGVAVALSGKLPVRPTPRVLLAPLRLTRMARAHDPAGWESDAGLQVALEQVRALDMLDLEALSWSAVLNALREALLLPRALAGEVRVRYFPRPALAAAGLRLLLGLIGHGGRFAVLLSGAETRTLQANRGLETLAHQVRTQPQLADVFARLNASGLLAALEAEPDGRAWLADLRAFLDHYGHREAVLTTASLPTWREAPEIPLGIVKGLALQARRPAVEAGHHAWEIARDDVLTSPWLRLPPLHALFLKWLHEARYLLAIREDTHFFATLPLPAVRRIVLELGRRLVAAGVLDRPEHIFHLKLSELEHGGQAATGLRATVQRRIARRAALEGTPLIPQAQRAAGPTTDDAAVLVRGTPGQPGVAEGPVRVIRDGSEFGNLRPGDVLVAPYTNPGWTPLFQHAAAVVADTGGAASHAAIVAREYGIPAVMGTIDGTRRLVDGERVRVDGSRGLVERANQ